MTGLARIAAFAAASALLCTVCAAPSAAAGSGGSGWTTWGNSSTRQSRATTSLLTSKTATHLRVAWTGDLGGVGNAQPLYLKSVKIGGKARDIYLAAGEHGRVVAYDALTGNLLWKRELGALRTGCSEMPDSVFGVTGTPVYDPAHGFVYFAAGNKLWAFNVRNGASRAGWPVILPIDPTQEHVWGALTLGNGHVYLGTASYCDHQPYSGRVISVTTDSGAVDHSWASVNTMDGTPGGGGIWGWGGVAITADGHVWAATSNANSASSDSQTLDHAQTVDELTPDLKLLASGPSTGMLDQRDLGFGSTPIVFKPTHCAALVAAEGKDGALYLWQRAALPEGPAQRLVVAYPATLYGSPAWDPKTQQLFLTTSQGYQGVPGGLDALSVTSSCRMRVAWTRPLGGQLNSVPTVVNDTVVVGTGTGQLRVYTASSGKLVAHWSIPGHDYVAPIAVGRDVAVVTWDNDLVVFRLPAS
ncbi:MAG: PQQ-binding-like beta-propeller repeat protein [Actinomycetota bacterium]|nr:PQQ-binding-like beta-propeller repeat protein [Actinomycetota bacterium]